MKERQRETGHSHHHHLSPAVRVVSHACLCQSMDAALASLPCLSPPQAGRGQVRIDTKSHFFLSGRNSRRWIPADDHFHLLVPLSRVVVVNTNSGGIFISRDQPMHREHTLHDLVSHFRTRVSISRLASFAVGTIFRSCQGVIYGLHPGLVSVAAVVF